MRSPTARSMPDAPGRFGPDLEVDTSFERPARDPEDAIGDRPDDRGVTAMRAVFRQTGGMATGADLARLLEHRARADFERLAHLIVSGRVFGFEWQRAFWIPMFQFDLRDLSIRPQPRQVVRLLGVALDGWALAAWFARPNDGLNRLRPVGLLDSDPCGVVDAACADLQRWTDCTDRGRGERDAAA